jgi:NHLM bacteriocin system ABC transporter peptidase/ATP-binding protein
MTTATMRDVAPRIQSRHRTKTPTLIQMEAVECGAASLGIILAHYGRRIPLEELRRDCGVSRDGSTAASIMKAARRYGMDGKGLQLDLPDLPTLPLPAILFWRFNHFLVLEGYNRRKVWLNDPGTGPRKVSWDEFDESFTGIALTLHPGREFVRGGRRHSLLGALLERRPSLGSALYLAVLLGAIVAAVGLTIPALTRVFIDNVLVGGDAGSTLGILLAAMAAAAVLTVIAAVAQQRLLVRGEAVMALGSAARFVRHLLRLPVVFFDQRQPADLANRVRSNDVIADVLVRRAAVTVVDCVLVITYGILLARYDLLLAAIAVVFAGLNVVALRMISALRKNAVAGLQIERGQLASTVFAAIQMVESIKASGDEQTAFQRFASRVASVTSSEQRLGVPTAVLAVVPPLLATLNVALLLWLGNYRVLAGVLTVGTLIAMQGIVAAMNRPVTNLTVLGSRVQETSADLQRLRDVERFPVVASERSAAPAVLSGHLRIEDVSFGYNPLAKPLVSHFSLDLAPGSRVALVGTSGSGKSTIARLVAGLYEPWEGTITVDGLQRSTIDPDAWAATLAMVDQETTFFEGTVRDNVSLWDPSIDDDEIVAALTAAAIYDEVARRPGGLGATVEEGGRNFSGGQRQRLEIARSLIRRPRVIVLDEATSALDAETEQIIDLNLRRMGATCLLVAHRLSTIRDCDQIVVISPGGELERGTHDELIRRDGAYAGLVREQ